MQRKLCYQPTFAKEKYCIGNYGEKAVCGSAFVLSGSGSSFFLKADPDTDPG